MAKFIIVEDTPVQFEGMKNILESHGHTVYGIVRLQTDDSRNAVAEFLTNQVGDDDPIDFLILDINWPDNRFGGVSVYTHLIRKGLRRRWKHTLVCSRYTDLGASDATALRVFLQASFIPMENCLPKIANREDRLLERVAEIQSKGVVPLVASVSNW